MKDIRDSSGFESKLNAVKKQLGDFLNLSKTIRPSVSAMRFLCVYLLLGWSWILFSDKALRWFTRDPNTIAAIQLYKGWVYVAISGIVFFLIIYKQVYLYKISINRIFDGYKEVSSSYEELMRMESKLYTYAYIDPITQLPNRTKFMEIVDEQILRVLSEDGKLALILVDIDDFKHINDMMGHVAGDLLIAELGKVLAERVKRPNTVARVGGDEYAIMLADVQSPEAVCDEIRRIQQGLRLPWGPAETSYFVTVSMGIALYPDHGTDLVSLMQNADTAVYHRKENGKNGFSVFDADMREKTIQFVQMSNQMIAAIQNHEFMLYYQPEIDLTTGKLFGVEALIRWNNPVRGLLTPKDFIPFAEKTGQINEIDGWVFSAACRQLAQWRDYLGTHINMSVNVSGICLLQDGLTESIRKAMDEYRIDGSRIIVEVTETALLADLDKAVEVLGKLKEMGITLALDDFGTGYSSLTYLQRLPIDIVKVDRVFINHLMNNDSIYIFKLIVDLVHHLGMKVVAEGVETLGQLELLTANRCDIGQGYYYSEPVPPEEMEIFLQDWPMLK